MTPSLFSGLLASAAAIIATVSIERFGGRLGGLIASIPSTIVPASLGFWWASSDVPLFQDALYAVPGGMLVNAAFLYCWKALPGHLGRLGDRALLAAVTTLSLLAWSLLAAGLNMLMGLEGVSKAALGGGLFSFQVGIGFVACWHDRPAPKGSAKVPALALLARGALAGLAIGISVIIASLGIPVLAGIASVFPAIFLTTMVSVWWAQGPSVPIGAVGPMILGSNAVSAYSLAAAWTMPYLGAGGGAITAWVTAIGLVSLPSWFYLRWRAAAAISSKKM